MVVIHWFTRTMIRDLRASIPFMKHGRHEELRFRPAGFHSQFDQVDLCMGQTTLSRVWRTKHDTARSPKHAQVAPLFWGLPTFNKVVRENPCDQLGDVFCYGCGTCPSTLVLLCHNSYPTACYPLGTLDAFCELATGRWPSHARQGKHQNHVTFDQSTSPHFLMVMKRTDV